MVRLHPLVVILAVALGVVLAGIVGAVFAVPAVLVLRALAGSPAGSLVPGREGP